MQYFTQQSKKKAAEGKRAKEKKAQFIYTSVASFHIIHKTNNATEIFY